MVDSGGALPGGRVGWSPGVRRMAAELNRRTLARSVTDRRGRRGCGRKNPRSHAARMPIGKRGLCGARRPDPGPGSAPTATGPPAEERAGSARSNGVIWCCPRFPKWLTGTDFSGAQFVQAIFGSGPSDYTFGYGRLSNSSTAAFVGNANPDGTLVQGLPTSASITVNSNGAFFSSGYTVGPQGYTGGTLAAQAFILLHELGHEVGAAGFKPDFGDPSAGKANDALVDQNCGKAIKGIK
jgi:hypothetical protein